MSKLYLITDTHFNHKNMVEKGWRPADYQQQLIDNWKAIVKPDDTVVHLGDVIFSHRGELSAILQGLPGYKVLIKGNHDTEKDQWYLNHGFDQVIKDAAVITEDQYNTYDNIPPVGYIVLSHEPFDMRQCKEGKAGEIVANIHGHLHKEIHRTTSEYPYYNNDKNFLLSMEFVGYRPIGIDEFVYYWTNLMGLESHTGYGCKWLEVVSGMKSNM